MKKFGKKHLINCLEETIKDIRKTTDNNDEYAKGVLDGLTFALEAVKLLGAIKK